jgi:hypothetical protein
MAQICLGVIDAGKSTRDELIALCDDKLNIVGDEHSFDIVVLGSSSLERGARSDHLMNGGEGGNRTLDPGVMNAVL